MIKRDKEFLERLVQNKDDVKFELGLENLLKKHFDPKLFTASRKRLDRRGVSKKDVFSIEDMDQLGRNGIHDSSI